MEINKNSILIDVYRSSQKCKETLNKYFNPSNNCFGCMFISSLKLEEACKQINKNLEEVLRELR